MARRFDIRRDEIKERHTSHWDWDCMSSAELDAAMLAARDGRRQAARRERNALLLKVTGAGVALSAAAAGLLAVFG